MAKSVKKAMNDMTDVSAEKTVKKTAAAKAVTSASAKAEPAVKKTAAKKAEKPAAVEKAAPAKKTVAKKAEKTVVAEKSEPAVKKVAAKKAEKTAVAEKSEPAVKKVAAKKAEKPAVEEKAAPAKNTAAKKAEKPAAAGKKLSAKAAAKKAVGIPVSANVPPIDPVEQIAGHTGRNLKNVLSPEKKAKFRALLLEERKRFENAQSYHREHALRSRKDVIDSNSTIMTHMADAGSDVFQQTFNLNMLTNENDVLEMVEEALIRLDEDEYGICQLCGKIIPDGRLEFKPYARFCIECKKRVEQFESPEFRHR